MWDFFIWHFVSDVRKRSFQASPFQFQLTRWVWPLFSFPRPCLCHTAPLPRDSSPNVSSEEKSIQLAAFTSAPPVTLCPCLDSVTSYCSPWYPSPLDSIVRAYYSWCLWTWDLIYPQCSNTASINRYVHFYFILFYKLWKHHWPSFSSSKIRNLGSARWFRS